MIGQVTLRQFTRSYRADFTQFLQSMQQDAIHVLPVGCGSHDLLRSRRLGQWHQSRICQETKQTDKESWTGHWDQSGLTEISFGGQDAS